MTDGQEWLAALREATDGQTAVLADMADFVRRSLAKSFGRQLGDADLEDLTQDVLVQVHRKHGDFRGDSRFSTWVAAIAVRTALSELRRRKHKNLSLEEAVQAGGEQLAQAASAPGDIQQRQQRQLLHDAIQEALTDRQREALLAELGGLPMEEVARRLGSKRGAVYKLLHDARKRLRAHLTERGFDATQLAPTEGTP